ncbi:related to 2`-hydroxyisoflavone reductase [Phialocephala subalpina]|uniref:Related to 2`-hydroxyisoflavone reductase n=1 Tax=Phialocephala subalpina TaxID=576137 RepID=A0A1L7WZ48_9HELO|nr:related to 2`-hydroxyisoflavone reductase [Phialocephala subalpina]
MAEIKSVAIAGATGTLGPHVLKALVNAGFQVTVLTRSKKPGASDANAKVLEVDFASVESLTTALKDIDAVVSTVGGTAIDGQTILIDAAIAAGVKRFIPSEYGTVTTSPKLETYPLYSSMTKIRKYLQEKASAGKLTWTVLACGCFLEFLFGTPTLLDFANHKVNLYDEGDNRMSSTSMVNIGKAIAAILKNPDATKDKVVYTSEVILTQNKVLGFAKELKPEIKWEITKVQTSVLRKESLEAFGAGDFSMPVMMKLLAGTALAGDLYGGAYDQTDNELLGIKELTGEDVKKLVAEKLV